MDRRRFVFDTNVLVSALLLPGPTPRRAFSSAVEQGVILVSTATLDELAEVIRRPKLKGYVTEIERALFLARLVDTAEHVTVVERLRVCRDPKDDKLLELAAAGGADLLVTGDADLLVLGRFRDTEILTPAALLQRPGQRRWPERLGEE